MTLKRLLTVHVGVHWLKCLEGVWVWRINLTDGVKLDRGGIFASRRSLSHALLGGLLLFLGNLGHVRLAWGAGLVELTELGGASINNIRRLQEVLIQVLLVVVTNLADALLHGL